jgi:hypothetical protein
MIVSKTVSPIRWAPARVRNRQHDYGFRIMAKYDRKRKVTQQNSTGTETMRGPTVGVSRNQRDRTIDLGHESGGNTFVTLEVPRARRTRFGDSLRM